MPKTASTPSALRHSMIASTARMAIECTCLARLPGRLRLGLREVEVAPAGHAHLVVKRDHAAALRTAPHRLSALRAPEDRGDRPDHRQDQSDHEPDPEGAALDLSDHPG